MTGDERIALAEEEGSLPIHVAMCVIRHKAIIAKIDAADARARRIERVAWSILTLLAGGGLATMGQLLPIIQALAN